MNNLTKRDWMILGAIHLSFVITCVGISFAVFFQLYPLAVFLGVAAFAHLCELAVDWVENVPELARYRRGEVSVFAVTVFSRIAVGKISVF